MHRTEGERNLLLEREGRGGEEGLAKELPAPHLEFVSRWVVGLALSRLKGGGEGEERERERERERYAKRY